MTYSYTNPVNYRNYGGVQYDGSYTGEKKSSATSVSTTAGVIVGGAVGGYLGYKGHPYMSKDMPKDTFTKKVYSKYVEQVGGNEKAIHTQGKEILKEINKVKTVDELKTLLQNKQEAAREALGHSYDDIIANVTENNLGQNKTTIKNSIEAQQKNNIQKMKNWIQGAWDSKNKKFEKPTGMADDLFNTIKKSAEKYKFKNLGKGLLIGATLTGIAGFITSKIMQAKSQANIK